MAVRLGGLSEQLPDGIREIAAGQIERLANVVAGLSDADLVGTRLYADLLVAHLLVHVRMGFDSDQASPSLPGRRTSPTGGPELLAVLAARRRAGHAQRQARFYWANGSGYATADSLRGRFSRGAAAGGGDQRAGRRPGPCRYGAMSWPPGSWRR